MDLVAQEDKLLTRQDVADLLQVSLRTVDTLIHNKEFDGLFYIGRSVRISRSKLLSYINDHLQYKI